MENNFSIFVNTTDNFEDCWIPFFTLFKKYWPDYNGKIYLNTELKDFAFDNLNIITVKNKLTACAWSECLKHALDFVNEENILYLQEDYFLKSPVNSKEINNFYSVFLSNSFDCLHLTDQCTPGPFNKNTGLDKIWEVEKGANYRLSTQAAFWKKESLKKIILNWESGWQFEHNGSKRSNYLLKKIMILNTDKYGINKIEIIPYVFTGIIKGKWKNEVVDLFKHNKISVDLKIRGFTSELSPQKHSNFNLKKIIQYMKNLRSEINLVKIRLWQN